MGGMLIATPFWIGLGAAGAGHLLLDRQEPVHPQAAMVEQELMVVEVVVVEQE